MPKELANQLYPVGYGPWYKFDAQIVDNPTAWEKYDILSLSSGRVNQAEDNAALFGGYCIALEAYKAGMKAIAVAMPGSLIPAILGAITQPGSLLKIDLDETDGMRLVPATAADLAAGRVVGRYRNPGTSTTNIKQGEIGSIAHVLTGVL